MISIQSSLSELERSHQLRTAVLDAYSLAIKNIAHYPVELDEELTAHHRKHLEALADEVGTGSPEALLDSRATLRGLLRDYRDKAAQYIGNLRDELAGTARSLEEVLDSLGQADGDHETNLRTALGKLRQVAAAPGNAALGSVVSSAADSIENSLEQVRKQHQLTTSQFLVEIRMLHKRIDALEARRFRGRNYASRHARGIDGANPLDAGGAILPSAGGRTGSAPGGSPISARRWVRSFAPLSPSGCATACRSPP